MSLNVHAIVTVEFAKLVEAVNHYAAVMYNAASAGTASILWSTPKNIVTKRPKVVTISEKCCDRPVLAVVDSLRAGNSNILWAANVPHISPRT